MKADGMSKPKRKNKQLDLVLEYRYEPTPEGDRLYSEAMDIIADLILQDFETEQADSLERIKTGEE